MNHRQQDGMFLAVCIGLALWGHLFLMPALNVVEDESGYMQDAAQTTRSFLPFRDFGGTKGPLYLGVMHEWQKVTGRSVEASRFFSVVMHLASIPLFFALARRWLPFPKAPFFTTFLWAVSPVIVSLTTNVTHIPFELCLVLASIWLITRPVSRPWHIILGGVVFFAALMSRATAVAFGPVFLYLLLRETNRWGRVFRFAGGFLAVLAVTIAIIWPLYGWPKTAFFFNADALLIANGQRAVYAQQEAIAPARAIFLTTQPVWIDSLLLMGLALCSLPLFVPRKLWIPAVGATWLFILYGATQTNAFSFMNYAVGESQWWQSIARSVVIGLMLLCMVGERSEPVVLEKSTVRRFWILAAVWLGSFFLFYKGWGRSPTPFYPLESTPMFALLAGFVLSVWYGWFTNEKKNRWVIYAVAVFLIIDMYASFLMIPSFQYRGTLEIGPVREMTAILEERVAPNDALFTAQPVFAYASHRQLLGGYTHPGWYLSERAGYMPSSIRRTFLPDLPDLVKQVDTSINWIVLDWRTNDVYFNEGAEETEPMRKLLEEKFHAVITVANPASRDIVLYERNEHVGQK